MTASLTYDELKALRPCTDSLHRVAKLMGGAGKWNGKKVSAKQARKAGATFDDIVWVAAEVARSDADVERRLRLWLADCAAHVLHIFEAERPYDKRPRNAILTARQFARGQTSAAAWAAASDAARAAAWAAASDAARAAAWAAAWAAASDAARAAARDAARDAEQDWQFDRLILWLGKDEPEDWPLTSTERGSEQ